MVRIGTLHLVLPVLMAAMGVAAGSSENPQQAQPTTAAATVVANVNFERVPGSTPGSSGEFNTGGFAILDPQGGAAPPPHTSLSTPLAGRQGGRGARVAVARTSTQGHQLQLATLAYDLQPGAMATLIFWARADRKIRRTAVADTGSPGFSTLATGQMHLSIEWRQYQVQVGVPASRRVRFSVPLGDAPAGSRFDFDDFSLVVGPTFEQRRGADFEYDLGGWSLWVDPATKADAWLARKQSIRRSGSWGASLVVASPSQQSHQVQVASTTVVLQAGTIHTLSLWARADRAASHVTLSLDTGAPGFSLAASLPLELTEKWARFQLPFTPPATSAYRWYLSAGEKAVRVDVDDVVWSQSQQQGNPEPGGGGQPAPGKARVVADVDFERRAGAGGFNTGGFSVIVLQGSAATWSLQSPAAAHKGSYGARVSLTRPSPQDWRVQLGTPAYDMTVGSLATLIFWGRADRPTRRRVAADSGEPAFEALGGGSSADLLLGTSWRQFQLQLKVPPPPSSGGGSGSGTRKVRFGVMLGSAPAGSIFDFDDFLVVEGPTFEQRRGAGFEYDLGGWSLWVDPATKADAWLARKQSAKRSGAWGVSLTVVTPSPQNYQVQLASPVVTLQGDMLHTLSVWARADRSAQHATLSLDTGPPNFRQAAGIGMQLDTTWRHFLIPFVPPATGSYRWYISAGTAAVRVDLDDIKWVVGEPFSRRHSADFRHDASGFVVEVANGARAYADLAPEKDPSKERGGAVIFVDRLGPNDWDVQLVSPQVPPLASTCMWTFSFHVWGEVSSASPQGKTQQRIALAWSNAATYQSMQYRKYDVGGEWQRIQMSHFPPPGENVSWKWSIQFLEVGTYRVDDVRLECTPLDKEFARPEAVAGRIEKLRKGDLSLLFLDSRGRPVTAQARMTNLELHHTRHSFPFGTAFRPDEMPRLPADRAEWYKKTASTMFNALVAENRFKWPLYEPTQGQFAASHKVLEQQYFALGEGDMPVTLHALEWLIDMYGFDKHWSRQKGPAFYKNALEQRIKRDVSAFKGKNVHHYDVWNEVLHWRKLMDEWNLWDNTFSDAFKWAAAADPNATLVINDFGMFEDGSNDWELMVPLLRKLKAARAPLHGVGLQSHLQVKRNGHPNPDLRPEVVVMKLAQLAAEVPVLYISEFDLWTDFLPNSVNLINNLSEGEQADAFELFTRLFFSHPNIHGIWYWGFWDSSHWIVNGGMFRKDTTPKAAALRLRQLLFEEWTTRVSDPRPALSSTGAYRFRGFYGQYKYSVTVNGKQCSGIVLLTADRTSAVAKLAL